MRDWIEENRVGEINMDIRYVIFMVLLPTLVTFIDPLDLKFTGDSSFMASSKDLSIEFTNTQSCLHYQTKPETLLVCLRQRL